MFAAALINYTATPSREGQTVRDKMHGVSVVEFGLPSTSNGESEAIELLASTCAEYLSSSTQKCCVNCASRAIAGFSAALLLVVVDLGWSIATGLSTFVILASIYDAVFETRKKLLPQSRATNLPIPPKLQGRGERDAVNTQVRVPIETAHSAVRKVLGIKNLVSQARKSRN